MRARWVRRVLDGALFLAWCFLLGVLIKIELAPWVEATDPDAASRVNMLLDAVWGIIAALPVAWAILAPEWRRRR